MDASPLAVKLRIPERPHGVVPRPRLVQALEQGVPQHRLTIVAAPAGYGKTTLLAEWARATDLPVAWLSLDQDDNVLEKLLRYVLAAWARIQSQVALGPLHILLGGQGPNPEAVLAAFLEAAEQLPGHHAIVLDDYHFLADPAIHESLVFLLDHLPPRLHFVLGTRSDPPLPLARYRARAQLLELGDRVLRFNLPEATDFLATRLDMPLTTVELQHWHEQLEGWPAGLQLAALSRRHGGAGTISGHQRFIADYLAEDVLDRLPSDERDFLLRTSLLERLFGPLCEAMTGTGDAQGMLERLEREHLFVEALDEERLWLRYHALFAEFLQGELARRYPSEVAELHQRAAAWYAAHDLPEQAYEHALAGHDRERVIEIAERHLLVKLWRGEYRIVQHWLQALPEEWRSEYPLFGLVQAGMLAFSGQFDAAARQIDAVEQGLQAGANQPPAWQMARVSAIRCGLACTQNNLTRAEQYADLAQRGLRSEDVYFNELINISLGDTYRLNGRWQEAEQRYLAALKVNRQSPFPFISVPPLGALADLALRQGQLRQAAAYWREALAVLQSPQNWGSLDIPVVGWVHIRLGDVLYEWDQRAEAAQHLAEGLEWAEVGGDVRARMAGYLGLGKLKLTQGDLGAAEGYLEQARPLVEQAQFLDWAASLQRFQLELWLAQGHQTQALAWIEAARLGEAQPAPESEPVRLAAARALIVQGETESVRQAQTLLQPLLSAAVAEGRLSITIEALALQALAHWRRGDGPAALVALERALQLAEPEGYRRLLADLGLPMARVLQEARARGVRPAFVATLLNAFVGVAGLAPPGPPELPEPLTEREMEVLRLISAGLTNREIAQRLVISPETVKRHGASIYSKLGVGNRTQAVSRARELDLLA